MNASLHRLGISLLLFSVISLQSCFLFEDGPNTRSLFVGTLDYQVPSPRYFVDQPIPANQIVDFMGAFGDIDRASVSPSALPAGLNFDASDGDITGTPSAVSAATQFDVTFFAANNDLVGTASITISVVPAVPASGLSYGDNPSIYTEQRPIVDNVPSFTGIIDSYSVAPPLPSGLSLDPVSGIISGTPTTMQAATTYIISGSNPFGVTTTSLSIAILTSQDAAQLVVTDNAEPVLLTYIADSSPGNLYQRGYENLSNHAVDVTSDPNGRFVYVVDTLGRILLFNTQSGTARLSGGSLQATRAGARRIEMDSTGTRLLLLTSISLIVFQLTSDGSIMASESLATTEGVSDIVVHPEFPFAYVSNGFAGGVSVFSFEGTLTQLPGVADLAGFSEDLAISDGGLFLHVAETNSGEIHSFVIEARSSMTAQEHLLPLGNPASVPGGQIEDLAASPDGQQVFVSTGFNGTVEGYLNDSELNRLRPVFSTPVGSFVTELRLDQSARLLHILDPVQREVLVYNIAPLSITYSDRSRTRQAPGSMALVRATQIQNQSDYVFLSNETSNSIDTFFLNRSTATLEFGSQINVLQDPVSVVFNDAFEVAYVPERTAAGISMLRLDRSTRSLLPLVPQRLLVGGTPTHLVLGSAGRFAYALDSMGTLQVLAVDPSNGSLSMTGLQQNVAPNAGPLVVDPSGQYLYLLEPNTAEIAAFLLNPLSGAPLLIGRYATTPNPTELAMQPQGRELYVCGAGLGVVSSMRINAGDGSLSTNGVASPVGMLSSRIDIMAQGFNCYVGSAQDSTITILGVDLQSGIPISYPPGVSPLSIALGLSDLRVERGDEFVLASFGAPTSSLVLFQSQPDNSLLQMDSVPINPGIHRIEVNAPY